MNPQDPLTALNPLREPQLIGWWPLAPGWWLLLAVLLLCLGVALFFMLRRYRRNAYRRQALRQLQRIQQQYREDQNQQRSIAATNALLKSVAIHAYPQKDVASASGEAWLQFLNVALRPEDAFDPQFSLAVYSNQAINIELEAVARSAQQWIRQHRVAAR